MADEQASKRAKLISDIQSHSLPTQIVSKVNRSKPISISLPPYFMRYNLTILFFIFYSKTD